jgi:hypothetical protein
MKRNQQTPNKNKLQWLLFLLLLVGVSAVNAQSISIKTTVSGCYQSGGQSKATVSVEVNWSGITPSSTANDNSDGITVTIGTVSKKFDIGDYTSAEGNGTIISPQVIALEVNADGTTKTITASKGSTSATGSVTLPVACAPTTCGGFQTGGMVFNDYDADGTQDAGENSGIGSVTVKAFNSAGVLAASATTDAYGKYSLTGLTAASYPLRIEFSSLSIYGQGTLKGTNGKTTTQFVNAPSCSVNLGVLDIQDYSQKNPRVYIPRYTNGDPLPSGSSAGSQPGIITYKYGTSGLYDAANFTTIATAAKVGSIWGLAYKKQNGMLYGAAVLRRHVGLGPKGLGGLYMINTKTNALTSIDLTTLGINFGSIPSNTSRGLSTATTSPSADAQAFALVGKIGIGGIDISEDGNFLYLGFAQQPLNALYI